VKSATSTIPIVATFGDPVFAGLVTSSARPGGNLTDVSITGGFEIAGKKLQILKEAIPSASKFGLLVTWAGYASAPWQPALRKFNLTLGISLLDEVLLREATLPEIERTLDELTRQRPDAIVISSEAELAAYLPEIVALVEKHRLPALYYFRTYVEAGRLMAYSPDLAKIFRQLADDVRRILDGAKPGDIPIYLSGDQVRVHHQSEGRQGDRLHLPAVDASPEPTGSSNEVAGK